MLSSDPSGTWMSTPMGLSSIGPTPVITLSPLYKPGASTESAPLLPRCVLRKYLPIRSINDRSDGARIRQLYGNSQGRFSGCYNDLCNFHTSRKHGLHHEDNGHQSGQTNRNLQSGGQRALKSGIDELSSAKTCGRMTAHEFRWPLFVYQSQRGCRMPKPSRLIARTSGVVIF